jgi:hypothetical protein
LRVEETIGARARDDECAEEWAGAASGGLTFDDGSADMATLARRAGKAVELGEGLL